ncbi:MAG TPA: M18 family aminopeptidase [Acidimicrobiales bacterium]|nr:M18 family aminopeptidase [Acidimicrobiales bacterium]
MATTDTDADVADLSAYIDASPSPFHAVEEAARRLEASGAGYVRVEESDPPADFPSRGYVIRDGSFVAWADIVGDDDFRMIGAHTDSPNLRVKPRPDQGRVGVRQLALEPYGGLLLNSWLGRDLGISGRVALDDGRLRLLHTDAPVLHLPQLAIHLDREVNTKGVLIDPQRHTAPIFGIGPSADGDFARWVGQQLGVDPGNIVAWDLMTHDTGPATTVGPDHDLVSAPRLDNLCSSWAAVEALRTTGRGMITLWDHEEIGSVSNRGAASPLVETVLEQLVPEPSDRRTLLARGTCASSDMAHAAHPNYTERHEPNHLIQLAGGPVIKSNVNQRYATDARSARVFAAACKRASTPLQWYAHRADIPCGSTIGPITAGRLGISVVDVGAPMLAMHSARELMAVADVGLLRRALTAFLEG